MRMVQLTKQEKENILENLLKRSPNQYDEYQEAVNEILENVKKEGDKAVFDYTKRFDKADISKETLYVTEEEIKEAYSLVDADLIETMKKSIANIRDFHERQVRNSWFHTREDGVILGQRITALASVGVYVPGGKAAYPSSVLMNIIPAKVAGVKRIVMATPPGKDGKVTPVTSYPASCNSKAATELSVPPLIPSRTLLFGFIGANIRNQNEFFYILHSVILVQYYFSTSVANVNHGRG